MSWSDYEYEYADIPPDDGVETPAAAAAADDVVYVYPGARELAVFHDWYQHYHGYLPAARPSDR